MPREAIELDEGPRIEQLLEPFAGEELAASRSPRARPRR
jgi:hypothetical protein